MSHKVLEYFKAASGPVSIGLKRAVVSIREGLG